MVRSYTRHKVSRAQQVREERDSLIMSLIADGWFQSDIARRLGVSRQAVNQIVYRHKLNARKKFYYDLKNGLIQKSDQCDSCGALGELEAHHSDYREARAVQWLCLDCHNQTKKV